jgi:hypothetical protein
MLSAVHHGHPTNSSGIFMVIQLRSPLTSTGQCWSSIVLVMAMVRHNIPDLSRACFSMAILPKLDLHRDDLVSVFIHIIPSFQLLKSCRNAFLAGMILTTCIVQLPQRFMTVNGLSPLAAALRLLPFGVLVPIGASLAAVLMGKWKVPPVIICVAGAIFQILGLSFLSRTSSARHISPSQYGLQIITAIGNGFVNTAVVLLIPYAMQNRDLGEWQTISYPVKMRR